MSRRKLNVCFLVNELAPAGAQTLLLDIVRHTEAADVEYTVCFIEGDDTLAADFEAAGARVVDFGAEFKFDPRALLRLARFFQREQFDILHTHLPYAQTLGRIFGQFGGIRNVVSTQHSAPNNYHPITHTLEWLTRPLDSRTIAVAKAIERAFTGDAKEYEREQERQWCTIYNGIDVEEFGTAVRTSDTANLRSEWEISNGPVFLSVGRYTPAKAQDTLIEAMTYVVRELPDAQLLLVGWGELEDELRDAVRQHNLQDSISITGKQYPIHPYYQLADAFVLPSVKESFGIVLIEAMVAGLPVVATDVQGIPEIVENGQTGMLVPPRSPRELADAMVQLQDPERRKRLGEAGYKRAKNEFGIEQTTTRHLHLYRELSAAK